MNVRDAYRTSPYGALSARLGSPRAAGEGNRHGLPPVTVGDARTPHDAILGAVLRGLDASLDIMRTPRTPRP